MSKRKDKTGKTKKETPKKANQSAKPVSGKRMLYWLMYIVGIVLFQEAVIRFCYPLPELENFNRIRYQILDYNAGGPGFLRNINMTWRSTLDTSATFVHELNSYGFRDREWQIDKPKDKKRVFFVGDSFVEGMMSTQDKTIPEGFKEAAGSAADSYELFNCGMMGIGLNEYLKFIADAAPIFRPDAVVMVLYANDIPFQRPYQPASILRPKKYEGGFRLAKVVKQIKAEDPIPMRFARPTYPFYKPVPDPSNPWTANEEKMKLDVSARMAEEMKKGNFNFFRANWILEEEKFLKSQPDIQGKLAFARDYLNKLNCELVVFYVPSRSQITDHYYPFEKEACQQRCPESLSLKGEPYQLHRRVLEQDCRVLGIPFHDLTPMIKDQEDKGNHLYWNYDDHMRGKGYMMLGKAIYDRWN